MLFNKYLLSLLSLSLTPVFSAPTLIARQSSNNADSNAIAAEPTREEPPSRTTISVVESPSESATPTATSEALTITSDSASASASASPSRTVSYSSSASATPTGLHFTNKFPDKLKNGDQVDLEWEGSDGPYILYTILSYPGLSNVRPHVIERSTDQTSYQLTINEDDSHDKSSVTIGIGSNKESDQYKRITIPLYK